MKKIIAILLTLCIALSLMACGPEKQPSNEDRDTSSGTAEDQTESSGQETTTETADAMTLEQFLAKVSGIWILEETLWFFDDGGPCFDALMILEDQCTAAVYPGGIDRPGLYEGFTQIDEKTVQIALLYEATPEESYHGSAPEAHSTVTFVLTGNDTMQMKYEDGTSYTLIYGGKTFEEASIAVTDRKN